LETKTTFHSQKIISIMDSIAFVVPVAAFLMVVAIVYLESKVKMSMIEKGMNPADHKRNRRQTNPSQTLKNGLLFVGAGLGLMLAIIITNIFDLEGDSNTGIFFAMIAFFGGAGLLGAYFYERKNPPPPVE